MKKLLLVFAIFTAIEASAAVRYVDVNSASPAPPYTDWSTAATRIQDAINVASPGDEILVNDGIYQEGYTFLTGNLVYRVAVTKPVALRSVNGPEKTFIKGGTNQSIGLPRNVACVYLTNGASLNGFTMTNGYTDFGGGSGIRGAGSLNRPLVTDCVITGNKRDPAVQWATLNNCTVSDNFGNVYQSTASGCIISNNLAPGEGGGAANSILDNCILTANTTSRNGGGAAGSILNNCQIIGNRIRSPISAGTGEGGGLYWSWATNCVIADNLATMSGGGAVRGILVNCIIANNAASNSLSPIGIGGGAYFATVQNCLVVGNYARSSFGGGGLYSCVAINSTIVSNSAPAVRAFGALSPTNCIIYHNQYESNYVGDAFAYPAYSCIYPLPTNGVGNIDSPPQFVDSANGNFRLLDTSPCINAGLNSAAPAGPDLDGNDRIADGGVDMGAYEFQNQSPSVSCAFGNTAECGEATTLTVNVSDPEGDALTVTWNINGTVVQSDNVPPTAPGTITIVPLLATFSSGNNLVSVTVADTAGKSASCSSTMTVTDTTPPVIGAAAATPAVLWPPNGKMVEVNVTAEVLETCGSAKFKIVSVQSSEPVSGSGYGNTSPDWEIVDDDTILLRAERAMHGPGRIYAIHLKAADSSGNLSERKTVYVHVRRAYGIATGTRF